MYDFETVWPGKARASEKWHLAEEAGAGPEVVPMTVADMEFVAALEIVEEVEKVAKSGLWGYTYGDEAMLEAVTGWMARRNGWQAKAEWAVNTSGVVPAIFAAVRAFTEAGDGVLIQPPVYHPFYHAIERNGRVVVENRLVLDGDGYRMDLDDLREKAKAAKLMILCSPHNPVGRVWTREELLAVADICLENGVILFADEIHCDLILGERPFVAAGSLGEKYLGSMLIGTAASKTFSLAGLSTSTIFIPNTGLRERFCEQMSVDGAGFNSTFGNVATRAAYLKGEPWLDALLGVLQGNAALLEGFLEREIPGATMARLEGTYLAWVDLRCLRMDEAALTAFLHEAGLYANPGEMFGPGGEGHIRINLACPRQVLAETLERVGRAVKGLEIDK